MDFDNIDICPECNNLTDSIDMCWTHDCHGIPFRKVCFDCWKHIMDEKGFDGEEYDECDECIDYDY